MGSKASQPKAPGDATPLLYARSDVEGKAFEAQRNLIQSAVGLDGGGTVAADTDGIVYAIWHAKGAAEGESNRIVAVARSTDEAFARERPAFRGRLGACACCGIDANVGSKGTLHVLFRSATGDTQRDIWLLTSTDKGKRFKPRKLGPWKVASCMMSTSAVALGEKGGLFAWETQGQIYWARSKSPSKSPGRPASAPGSGKGRKHPAVARAADGRTILVWTDGTGWKRGGAVVWQVYGVKGRPTAERGRKGDLPAWSRPSAHLEGGTFVIRY